MIRSCSLPGVNACFFTSSRLKAPVDLFIRELSSERNGAGKTVSYQYDADGNPTNITYPLSGTWPSKTVVEDYDHSDLMTGITDFAGNSISVGANKDGQYNSVTLPTTATDTITTAYDYTGNPSAITLKQGASTLLGFSYGDAPSGDALSETDTNSGITPRVSCNGSTVSTCYTYDPSSNLATHSPSQG